MVHCITHLCHRLQKHARLNDACNDLQTRLLSEHYAATFAALASNASGAARRRADSDGWPSGGRQHSKEEARQVWREEPGDGGDNSGESGGERGGGEGGCDCRRICRVGG